MLTDEEARLSSGLPAPVYRVIPLQALPPVMITVASTPLPVSAAVAFRELGIRAARSGLLQRAFILFLRAASPQHSSNKFGPGGDSEAQFRLAKMYLSGKKGGAPAKSDGSALIWLTLAAGRGHAGAKAEISSRGFINLSL